MRWAYKDVLFLCGVCTFSIWLQWFPPGAPVSAGRFLQVRLGYYSRDSIFPKAVNVSVNGCTPSSCLCQHARGKESRGTFYGLLKLRVNILVL